MRLVLICIAVSMWGAHAADATCVRTDGCSICCPPGGPCSSSCDDSGLAIEASAGGAGELAPANGAGVIAIGVATRPSRDDVPRAARCAPLLCGILGIVDIPRDAWIGNRRGIQLRLWISTDRDVSVSLRPVFRVAGRGRWQTASFIGAALPEVGVDVSSGDVRVTWSPYPLVLRATRHISFELEAVRIGVVFADDRRFSLGGALSLTVLK